MHILQKTIFPKISLSVNLSDENTNIKCKYDVTGNCGWVNKYIEYPIKPRPIKSAT